MNFWRCKCGERQYWESGMPPSPCDVCDKCGSTLAMGPNSHQSPEPHQWEKRFDQRTGAPKPDICSRCHARKSGGVEP